MDVSTFGRHLQAMLNNNIVSRDVKVTGLGQNWVNELNYDFVHGQKVRVNGSIVIAPFWGRVVDIVLYPTFDKRHFEFIKLLLSGRVCRNFACIIHDRDLVDKPLFAKDMLSIDIKDYSKIPRLTCNDSIDISDNAPVDYVCKKYKKLHVHIVCYMQDSAFTNVQFAKKYYLDSNNVRVFGKLKPRLAYLVHGFNADKATYSVNEMCATNYMLQKTDDSLVLELYSDYDLYKIFVSRLENLIDSGVMLDSNICMSMIYENNLLPYFKQNRGICFRIMDEYIKKCDNARKYQINYENEVLTLQKKIVDLEELLKNAGVDVDGFNNLEFDLFDLQKENGRLRKEIERLRGNKK